MKKNYPLLVFILLMGSSVASSVINYQMREAFINHDVQNALAKTMAQCESMVVDADTIATYKNNITIDEIRDTACISVRAVRRGERNETVLEANAGCSFMTVLSSSNQRTSVLLAITAAMWAVGCAWYGRRRREEMIGTAVENKEMSFGGICYNETDGRFTTTDGTPLRFTPMQHQLMEMFFHNPQHTLAKQHICETLWPKKPDASDTLYTLIRRLKPIIEQCSDLKIESDRGRDYILTDKA